MNIRFAPTLLTLAIASSHVHGSVKQLADKPLFLGLDVPPNVLWLVDDSGSMDWEKLLTKEALAAHSSGSDRNFFKYYLDFASPGSEEEKRELCSGYNVMAYDPGKHYEPWSGKDRAGVEFNDADVTAARKDPYNLDSDSFSDTRDNNDADYDNNQNTQDLRQYYYYPWTDLDNDGAYDVGECDTSDANRVRVGSLNATQQQNYANWFSYYRKREFVAKRALSSIISGSQARMGLATLHNNNSVGTLIQDVDDIALPQNPTAKDNKSRLLDRLFKVNSTGGTPLRRTLQRAGEYFELGVNPGSYLFGFSPNPSSPILPAGQGGECQQNFSILLSDGYWNGSDPNVGNTDINSASSTYDGKSYSDSYSNTLADVAMHFYERDLATSLNDRVPVIAGVDDNKAQHMVTYTVAFGVNGQLDANPTDRNAAFTWPEPVKDSATSVDDMRHAAWKGRGECLNAADPDSLIRSLEDAINDIADRQGSASAVAFNSTSLTSDSKIFQARFDSGAWNGSLLAYDYDEEGLGAIAWNAAERLDQRDLSLEPRQIVTYNGSRGVAFQFPNDYVSWQTDELSPTQSVDLLQNAPFSAFTTDSNERTAVQAYGENLVAYLRGDDSLEESNGGPFRNRLGKRLGDIVHSSPEYVGKPNRFYPNKIEGSRNLYSDFVKAQSTRKALVYVGANDGMLHAFDSDTGEEAFAYIPGLLYSSDSRGLNALADPDYEHKAYVDGELNVADVFVQGQWRSYLVGALRAGAQGIYVLDVTDPTKLNEANSANIVVREFSNSNLGHVFGRPQIAKMNNGRWAAIVGNGYLPKPSQYLDGHAKIFIVYLDQHGGYDVIDTGVGTVSQQDCSNSNSDCNGMAAPTAVDLDGNGTVDRVYAGDLQGNLWAFDVSDSDENSWSPAFLDNANKAQPLFTACSAATCTKTNRQAITSAPIVKAHPNRSNLNTEPNLMLYIGTGQYFANPDINSNQVQSMYGIWDAGQSLIDRNDLQVQLVSDSSLVAGGRDLTRNTVDYALGSDSTNAELGWYIDLPDSGERVVVQPAVVGDILFFNTMVPNDDTCGSGGYGYLMFVDRMNGGQPEFTVLDVNDDGVFVDDIVAGIEISDIPSAGRFIDGREVISDSGGQIADFKVQTQASKRSTRSSWATY